MKGVIEIARDIAIEKFPTENGFFDAKGRFETFILECLKRGVVVIFGGELNEEEIDSFVKKFGLDIQ